MLDTPGRPSLGTSHSLIVVEPLFWDDLHFGFMAARSLLFEEVGYQASTEYARA